MGEVWQALDSEIGRTVALKRLREGRGAQSERFLAEAQITGQLEHPSIVPVHDIGADDQGRPFYIMKFLHGRRLRDAIADHHAADPGPTPREVRLLRLLESFVQLCQAVAYAHSRGVIHRDVKPANVILGEFGETVVIDWGLAKLIAHPEGPGDPTTVHVTSGGSHQTQDGPALGTPSYMAPELAEGRASEGDERTDVYLLGATLYEILTGQPPRRGASHEEMIELARNVPPVPPRKVRPDVPRALEAVCLKAMATRKQDRYPSALALADDVQRHLAGEPVTAYREGWTARAGRWCRRHRRALARAAVAAGVLCLLVAAAVVVRQEQRRRAEAEREAGRLGREQEARAAAAEFRRRADAVRFYAASTDPEGEHAPYYDPRQGADEARKALALLDPWGDNLDGFPLAADREGLRTDAADLLLRLAQLRCQPAPDRDTARSLLAGLERARALGAVTRSYHRLRAVCHRALGEGEQAEEQQRRADDPATPDTALDHFLQGEHYRIQGGPADGESRRRQLAQAAEAYRLALERSPQDFWSHFQLGRCSLALGRSPDAMASLSACVALRPEEPWGYSARGLAQGLRGQPAEGLRDLDRALALDPDFPPARLNRGVLHLLAGRREDAEADFTAVLTAPAERRLIEAAYYRARLALERGDPAAAARDLDRVLAEKPHFGPAYPLRARLYLTQGQHAEALAVLDRSPAGPEPVDGAGRHARRGRLLRSLIVELPMGQRTRALWELARRELEIAWAQGQRTVPLCRDLGSVRHLLGDHRGAAEAFSEGLALDPAHVPLRTSRGWAHVAAGQPDRAREDFTEAARLAPRNAELRTGLGYLLAGVTAPAEAAGAHREAQREALRALRYGAGDYLVYHNVACVFATLARTEKDREEEYHELTVTLLEQAVEMWQEQGSGPSEIDLIKQEPAFGESLRARPDFRKLLEGGGGR
jgi:tetratricopeptide (TPR) repeat protein/tRNA A-37 threonylcarbamoyl transferase component Bud32